MHDATFDGTADGWRRAARALLAADVPPARVAWRVAGAAQGDLALALPAAPAPTEAPRARVPAGFVALLARVACHRAPERWARLYRALWRLAHGEPHLLELRTDPDVRPLLDMARAVDREVHKLHAFVRFRVVPADDGAAHVAWYEPAHPVLALAAPFFARRFASMRWAILTPDASAWWDGAALAIGPGVRRPPPLAADDAEALWRTYYASTFNPARANATAMRAEMPTRYWRNLPEAALIPGLLRDAPARVRAMVARERERPTPRAPDAVPVAPLAPALRLGACEVRVGHAALPAPDVDAAVLEVTATRRALPSPRTAAAWGATPALLDVHAHALLTGHAMETARLPRALRDLLPPGLAGATRLPADALDDATLDAAWARVLASLAPLRVGALLVRLPSTLAPSRPAAEALRRLHERLHAWRAAGRVAAVELSHPGWLAPRLRARTAALLERLELALVTADVPLATHPALAVVRDARLVEALAPRVAAVHVLLPDADAAAAARAALGGHARAR